MQCEKVGEIKSFAFLAIVSIFCNKYNFYYFLLMSKNHNIIPLPRKISVEEKSQNTFKINLKHRSDLKNGKMITIE